MYIEVTSCVDPRSGKGVVRLWRALRFARKIAYPAAVSARMKIIAFYLNDSLLIAKGDLMGVKNVRIRVDMIDPLMNARSTVNAI
jgi:hypothetical protein